MVNKHGPRAHFEVWTNTPHPRAACPLEPSSPTKPRLQGSGSEKETVLIYPIFTCSCVCEAACQDCGWLVPLTRSRAPYNLSGGPLRLPRQLTPPTLPTRAALSLSGLWLLKLERDIPPSPPPSIVERLEIRTPNNCRIAFTHLLSTNQPPDCGAGPELEPRLSLVICSELTLTFRTDESLLPAALGSPG